MNADESFEKFAVEFQTEYGYLPLGKDDLNRPSAERILGDLCNTYRKLRKAEAVEQPLTSDKTPAAPLPEGEVTPSWCNAKVCEYSWRKCEEELCCFDKR